MHLPLRTLLIALLLIVIPSVLSKLAAAEPWGTHYRGDYARRPFDGSYRYDSPGQLSSSSAYRAPQPTSSEPRSYEAPQSGMRSVAERSDLLSYDGVPLLAPIWSGLYGGVHGGGGWGEFDTSIGGADLSGALLGAHVGYLLRSGALVAGLEFDADLSQLHDTSRYGQAVVVMADIDWIVSARARLGVVAGPALLYATGGVALMGVSSQANVMGAHSSSSDTQSALVVGGGLEIGLGRNTSLRLEALHYILDEERQRLPSPLGTTEVGGSVTTIRAGLTFYFN